MFLNRKQLAEMVAPLALTAEGFQTLPGAPKAFNLSPRRRRWRRAEVVAFLDTVTAS